jgi:pyruvate dehydrogenase E2 component (dihydrolipoamide acetyltransferase)
VDIASIRGTGPGGALSRADVLAARPGAAATAVLSTSAAGPGGVSRTRLGGNQAAVARKVSKSWAETPVYHVSMQADMGRAQAFRTATPVSFDALFVRAVGMALAEFPLFRSHVEGSEVVRLADCAVAIAVSVEEDLYAPVLRAADSKTAAALSREIEELAARARSRSLAPAEMEGGCILVSNLGMLPVESFDAIVYPGHSAALAVGAALPTPVAAGGAVRVAPLARLTLSADHRLINGTTAAQFLARVKQILESGAFA